jgi:cyclic beta-1,2-glucan synthetase
VSPEAPRRLPLSALAEAARSCAREHAAAGRTRPHAIRARIERTARLLNDALPRLPEPEEGVPGARAIEWLLDNAHLIAEALDLVSEGLTRGFVRRLPALVAGGRRDVPRVLAVAHALLADDARLDIDRARAFLDAYQSESQLELAELWALPLVLRLALLEDLAAAATALAGVSAARHGAVPAAPHARVETDHVAECVQSLRVLATTQWDGFIESVSRVHRILCRDPAAAYAAMDFESRDRYRRRVEELGRWGGVAEDVVAAAAIELAEREVEPADGPDGTGPPGPRHVGWALVGPGRGLLEARLGIRPPAAERIRRRCARHATGLYFASILAGTAILLAALLVPIAPAPRPSVLALALLLGVIPAHSLAVEVVHWLVTLMTRPRILPKLELSRGVPARHRTAVVVPALVTDAGAVRQILEHLELNYHANPERGMPYCVLADFADAPARTMPEDAALLAQLEAGVRGLNARLAETDDVFYLLYRERQWNPRQACWMGRERKRGKLDDFNRLVLTGASDLQVRVGDADRLRGIRYAITLDADTLMPQGAARRMIGALAHPLNRPVFDARGRVVAGYTVLQPRVEILPTSSLRTMFARTFASDRGIDLYTLAVSDVYQDLFGEGIFVGKGIYDIAAFDRSLAGVVPDNALLSHDLFEGIHGRAGLLSDVVAFEDYPADVLSYMRRLHRWVRGDWQLVPWLRSRVPAAGGGWRRSRLSALDRWKILDNLRRSVLAVSLVLLALAGWTVLHGPAWWWTLAAAGPFAAPVVLGAVTAAGSRAGGHRGRIRLYASGDVSRAVRRWLVAMVLLPFRAGVELDAIGRTLVRLFVTRRNLLEWTSAAQTASLVRRDTSPGRIVRHMAPTLLVAAGAAAAVAVTRPAALPAAAPLLLAWLVAPFVVYRIGRQQTEDRAELDPADARRLRRLARRTWHFFETFVGPADQWLPPDHFQEEPRGMLARRTSPTNIGFLALSTLAAYDLGYLTVRGLAARLSGTFRTLALLEHYRGHLLNWYETSTLAPLEPRYVSTVDSGNLAGALLAVARGCREAAAEPLPRRAAAGLGDTLAVLSEVLYEAGLAGAAQAGELVAGLAELSTALAVAEQDPCDWADLVADLAAQRIPGVEEAVVRVAESEARRLEPRALAAVREWLRQSRVHAGAVRDEIEALVPWLAWPGEVRRLRTDAEPADVAAAWSGLMDALPRRIPLAELPAACTEIDRRLDALGGAARAHGGDERLDIWVAAARARVDAAAVAARRLLADLDALAGTAERMVAGMDFRFLYDRTRRLFHIGYDVTAGRLDTTYYDLLASEARLASLIAIAKGDAPARHWLHLGRPFRRVEGVPVLMSWGGSMFEYLLPPLLTHTPARSLAEMAERSAVELQRRFGSRHGVPWGISESAFFEVDAHGTYQYRAFGVPALALRRMAGDRLVIAPYATLLALEFAPRDVLRNLDRLAEAGAAGPYGMYEAVDFGPTGHARPEPRVVRSYMAHHQGMILVAITNALQDGVMRARFHADPRIGAASLLLHERVPGHARAEPALPVGARRPAARSPAAGQMPAVPVDPHAAWPRLQVLSNGTFSTLVTARGAGGLRWNERSITSWTADPPSERQGVWLYVRDVESARTWSLTEAPVYAPAEASDALFGLDSVEFRRRSHGILSRLSIVVAPDAPLEIRRVSLSNESGVRRRLRVTTYGELALVRPAEYDRHPAFAKLFVESRFLPNEGVLLFHRRAAAPGDATPWVAHGAVTDAAARLVGFETDRARFIGRGRSCRQPRILDAPDDAHEGATGTTLDPIFSLTHEVVLEPGDEVGIDFITAAGLSGPETLANLNAYGTRGRIDRAFERAASRTEREIRELGLAPAQAALLGPLLTALLHPQRFPPRDGGDAPQIAAQAAPLQSALWGFGISGDLPLIVMTARAPEAARPLIAALIRMQAYWRRSGVPSDLVVLDESAGTYEEPLRGFIHEQVKAAGGLHWLNRSGGVHHVPAHRLDARTRAAARSAASVLIDSERGDLAAQLAPPPPPPPLPPFVPVPSAPLEPRATPSLERRNDLQFDNGLGGFDERTGEYVIHLEPGRTTPAPWSNVVANPAFGFLATEAGLGFTWSLNSGEHRLTPWRNDPVSDPPGEVLYIRDEETGEVWTPTPMPAGARAPYEVRHGTGRTVFRHASHCLDQQVLLAVPPEDTVKFVRVRLRNLWPRQRRLTLTYYVEWVLGASRRVMAHGVVTTFDAQARAIFASQGMTEAFAGRVAFVATGEPVHGATADRVEFLGAPGDPADPAALRRIGLAGTFGADLDPCAALQVHVDLAPDEDRVIDFLLGDADGPAAARALIRRYADPPAVEEAIAEQHRFWDGLLGRIEVRTPDPALDLMVNRWLPYQALSSRIRGRTGFYQSSGAYGFRDQLQDVMAFFATAPDIARAQILEAARRQFREGDVLHWWHPPSGAGVRTRCSDDLLWLPYVTASYVEATGDAAVLDEDVPFLAGAPLAEDETERYDRFDETDGTASLFEHCLRALDRASTRGAHGLPLIGTGDWNDAMDRVGAGGRGESVWLGWFLYATLDRFAALCEARSEHARAAELRERARGYAHAIETHGWDGGWYRRAFFDDGSPLGSTANAEGRIDSLTQSWAVLSGGADPERARTALNAARDALVREDRRLVLLLEPPFDRMTPSPGYIRAYPPGVRENGGQYTHAAVWLAWAFARLGDGDEAGRLLGLLNPVHRAATPDAAAVYRVEPYVVAADVYGVEPHTGRGGWTWYTGSAAWLYRLAVEAVLGIRRERGRLVLDPCIPRDWPGFEATVRDGATGYFIRVRNPDGVARGIARVEFDGRALRGAVLPRPDDGRMHEVTVELGVRRRERRPTGR